MKALLLFGFLVLLAATAASARTRAYEMMHGLIFALSLAVAPELPWVCGPREVFKECVSSTCAELKCGMEGMPEACTMDCASGCFCAPGFYRKGHRECVPRSECQLEPLKPMPKA